jgi:hypothetical protein
MLESGLRCAPRYALRCAHGLCTWGAVNPRQHWPRGLLGSVRAGVYGNQKFVQARILVISDLVVERGEGLGRGEGRWLL